MKLSSLDLMVQLQKLCMQEQNTLREKQINLQQPL